MARGVNKVILVGNLGADPEMKYTASGTPLCTFSLATSENFNDRDGNAQERTEWHRIVVWGKLAEICGQYLSKGRQAYVEGSIRTSTWDDNGVKRYRTEINAREVQFLGGAQGGAQGGATYNQNASYSQDVPPTPDEDIPF